MSREGTPGLGHFTGTLAAATAAGLFDAVVDTWLSWGRDRERSALVAHRPEIEHKISEALEETRRERRTLAATGLGDWHLPYQAGENWRLWDSHYAPSGALTAARDQLKGFPGAPITIRTREEASEEYPGMVRVIVSLWTSTQPPRMVAKATFTSLREGQTGPIGFAPDGVLLKSGAWGDDPNLSDYERGRDGTLLWRVGDRLEGHNPRIKAGYSSKSSQISAHVNVTPAESTSAYAQRMALVMAVNNALACQDGFTPACGSEGVLIGAWPPTPKGGRTAYDRGEWESAARQVADLPVVREALAAQRVRPERLRDWLEALREKWQYAHGPRKQAGEMGPAFMRAILTERGDDAGDIRPPGGDDNSRFMTFPALIAEQERHDRMMAELNAEQDPAELINIFRRYAAMYPTRGWFSYNVLVEPLKRLGWQWRSERDSSSDLYDLTQGSTTWAQFAAKREAAQRKADAKREAEEAARQKATVASLERFAAFVPKLTPGFYTHAPTRERLMNAAGLKLDVLTSRHGPLRVRLTDQRDSDAFAIADVNVPQEYSDPAVAALRAFVAAAQRFHAGRTPGEDAERAMLRWEGLAIELKQGPHFNMEHTKVRVLGDIRPYMEDARRESRAYIESTGGHLRDSLRTRDASGWGLYDGLADYLVQQEDQGRPLTDNHFADALLSWVNTSTRRARELGLPVDQALPAFTVVWDFARNRPVGTTHPDGPLALSILRRASLRIASDWEHRRGIFDKVPKPYPAEWLQPSAAPGVDLDADALPPVLAPVRPAPAPAPEPPPLAAEPPPARPPPREAAQPVPAGVRGFRAARAARTGADVWPPTGKPVVQRLIELAPTPADFTPDLAAQLYAELEPRARGSLAVYLREAVALGRLDGDVIAAFGG